MTSEYQIVNGTYYHVGTPKAVIDLLEQYRADEIRVRLWLGSKGRCWNEEYGTIGTISRSMGPTRVPLLVCSRRSTGGLPIFDNRIVRIDIRRKVRIDTVYKDPNVRFDRFISTDIGTVYNETRDLLYARCKNADAGRRLAAYMNGERWAK